MTLDTWGHLGYILLLVGNLLIVRQHLSGWALRLAGNGLWVALGVLLGLSSIWIWGAVFSAIDIHAYRTWKKTHARRNQKTNVGWQGSD